MANLQLAVNAEYFDAMKRGEKTEEYRLVNAYWGNHGETMTTNRMGLEQSTLSDGELTVIAETDHVQCGDAAAMARELLAYREASSDPVVYRYRYHNGLCVSNWSYDEKYRDVAPNFQRQALYIGPQSAISINETTKPVKRT